MKRREFITLVGGAAVAWPVAPLAQQGERVRRIAVIIGVGDDAEGRARVAAFKTAMDRLGWREAHNVYYDVRYTAGGMERARLAMAEAVALSPDLIVANGTAVALAAKQQNQVIPVVFVQVPDPLNAGIVDSLSRPSGNITGFSSVDFSVATKWVGILKEIAPQVRRIATLRDPSNPSGMAQLGSVQGAAAGYGLELTAVDISDAASIERGIDAFAREQNGGLVITATPMSTVHLRTIVDLAARKNLPAIYPYRYFVSSGGLVSYGLDNLELYRQATSYVDRILKGELPKNLPVQAPTKYELVINLKTANARGRQLIYQPPLRHGTITSEI